MGPGAANRGRERPGAGRRFDPVPVRAARRPGRGASPAPSPGGTVHRILPATSAALDPGLRLHRRPGPRTADRPVFPRILQPLLLPAAVRVLRRPAAGELSAAEQHRRGQARLGLAGLADEAAAPSLAAGRDRVSRRQRLLPPADARLVRAQRCEIHRRHRPQRGAERVGCAVDGGGGAGVRAQRRKAAPVRRVSLRRRHLEQLDLFADKARKARFRLASGFNG